MIKILKKETYRLEAEGIDQISEEIGANLRKYPDLSRKDVLRLRLSAEDILMHWMGVAKDLTIELLIEEHGREVNITMSLDGITYKKDPLEMSGAEGLGMVDHMMAALGIGWLYQFDRGRNIIYTTVTTSHRNQAAELGVTLLCAVASVILLRLICTGLFVQLWLPFPDCDCVPDDVSGSHRGSFKRRKSEIFTGKRAICVQTVFVEYVYGHCDSWSSLHDRISISSGFFCRDRNSSGG